MAFDSEEHIRVRAYHLWEANGRPEGRDLEFWTQAQQALNSSSKHVSRRTRAPVTGKGEANRRRKRHAS